MPTELQTFESREARERRVFIRDGIPGNLEVVYAMIRLTRQSVKDDHYLEAVAKGLVKGDDYFDNTVRIFESVFNFVKDNVRYIPDVAGRIESIKSARVTLADGWGDCDDHAILSASLLGCLGFEDVRFCMTKYLPTDTTFVHIYTVCYQKGKRYVFDTTLPNSTLNKEVKPLEAQEFAIFQDVPGLDGLSGLYTNARYAARSLVGAVSKGIPAVVATMPLGFAFGNALATGANFITQSNTKPLSSNAIASRINQELDSIINDLLQSRIAHDLAITYAMQSAVQLGTAEGPRYPEIAESVQSKIKFIKEFPVYAEANNIRLVNLDATKMMIAGVGLAGFAAYGIYKTFIRKS